MTDRNPLEFQPEDFKASEEYTLEGHDCARIANAKLREWLDAAPVVYLNRRNTAPKVHAKYWTEYANDLTLDGPVTHKARLVCIEPINKGKT